VFTVLAHQNEVESRRIGASAVPSLASEDFNYDDLFNLGGSLSNLDIQELEGLIEAASLDDIPVEP
jgi:hypothetical protein